MPDDASGDIPTETTDGYRFHPSTTLQQKHRDQHCATRACQHPSEQFLHIDLAAQPHKVSPQQDYNLTKSPPTAIIEALS